MFQSCLIVLIIADLCYMNFFWMSLALPFLIYFWICAYSLIDLLTKEYEDKKEFQRLSIVETITDVIVDIEKLETHL